MAMSADIIFNVQGGQEILRICQNGDFMVRGRVVVNDWAVYEAFKGAAPADGS
jgi:hypothetical protein